LGMPVGETKLPPGHMVRRFKKIRSLPAWT
jgi:hypothetical protein